MALVLAAIAVIGLVAAGKALRHAPPSQSAPAEIAEAESASIEQGAAPAPASVTAWHEIASPEHIYYLEAPALRDGPVDYAARGHAAGGREDMLTIGMFDGDKPALRLRMVRGDAGPRDATPFFAVMAHEAASLGLSIDRSGVPGALPTRFGTFEVADLSLQRSGESAPLSCSGLRLIRNEPSLSIAGLVCGSRAAPMTRAEVGCLVERLDLAAVGNDRALADFFEKATPTQSCGGGSRLDVASGDLEQLSSNRTGTPATGHKSLGRH